MLLRSLSLFLATVSAAALPEGYNVFDGESDSFDHLDKRATSSYDYVVIGGGTAGLAIAARLAVQYTVAVIEAGSTYQAKNPLLRSSATPGGDVIFVGSDISDSNKGVDWEFVTTPQAGANNRQIHCEYLISIPMHIRKPDSPFDCRGKCLGGSSARNFMIYQRGSVDSYQKWADAVNDQSYSWNNFLPYFQKGVAFTPPNALLRAQNASAQYNSAAFTPGAGPLQVSYANYAQGFSSYMQGGLNAIGIPTVQDFNSGSLMGTQYCASTIDPSNEARASSQETYLASQQNNPKLTVYKNTLAKKINFLGTKATGVQVKGSGILVKTITANKEVIVSAGAFHSPQMLMVSGIGPAATLQKYGIKVLVNNPNVGQNMWDHIFAGPSYRVNIQTLTRLANQQSYIISQYFGPYQKKQGVLTNPVCDYLGWEKTPADLRAGFTPQAQSALNNFPSDWPEIEYLSGGGFVGNFSNLLANQPKDGYQYATILAALVAPLSRGNVTIASADTSVLPVINPNWLTDPTDQQVAIAAYKRVRAAWASPAMQKVVIGPEYYPGPQVSTDAQILAQWQNDLMTVWHASCTCAMGTSIANGAVVDSNARVFGVTGVRVVDASAFPLLPPGHPQSTVYALAEKIAAGILAGN